MGDARALVLLLAPLACQRENQLFDQVEQPIFSGAASGTGEDAVVQLTSTSALCTGTLVAPNLVLTARHCLGTYNTAASCQANGTSDLATSDVPTEDIDPVLVTIHSGATPAAEPIARGLEMVSTGSPTYCRNDIALLVLDRRLEQLPTLPIRLTRPTLIGESMTLIGYGPTGDITTGDASAPVARTRREGIPVLDVGANRFYTGAGTIPAGVLSLGPGMCDGDSGGPAISDAGAVVGVASVTASFTCGASPVSVYTQVAEYYDLVIAGFARAGAEPWIEGEASAMTSGLPAGTGCSMANGAMAPAGCRWGCWLLGIGALLAIRRWPISSDVVC